LNPHLGPAITLALALTITTITTITFSYISACVTWPFKNCRRCNGTGRRLRTGRKVWNFFHRLHGEAHR
jgi:hypothetical protein